MFGKLTLAAFEQGPIVLGAQMFIIVGAVTVIGLLTYFKRWKWLWREWLTSLDAKKIGVMYITVALVMLFRGFIDAAMMRTQQALSVGASHGFLEPHHFEQIFTAHGVIMIFSSRCRLCSAFSTSLCRSRSEHAMSPFLS